MIDLYDDNNPQSKFEDRILPVLSNQKTNTYLKEIAGLCNVNKNLTYYMLGKYSKVPVSEVLSLNPYLLTEDTTLPKG
jgi:hypothetical protein